MVLFLLLSSAGFVMNSALSALPEIRDCETEHYDITGDSGDDLLAEMKLKNETKGGYFAHTRYKYKNKCKEVTTTCTVRLPRWAEFDSSKNVILKQKWEKFYIALVAHEQGHVDIFIEDMAAVKASVNALTCLGATKKIAVEYKKMGTRQKAYDAANDHGRKLGATFNASSYLGIAYSPKTQALGWAHDAETKEAASQKALENCKSKDCKLIVWANGENYCASVAHGGNGAYGSAYGRGRVEAEMKSVTACKKYTEDCTILKTVCARESE